MLVSVKYPLPEESFDTFYKEISKAQMELLRKLNLASKELSFDELKKGDISLVGYSLKSKGDDENKVVFNFSFVGKKFNVSELSVLVKMLEVEEDDFTVSSEENINKEEGCLLDISDEPSTIEILENTFPSKYSLRLENALDLLYKLVRINNSSIIIFDKYDYSEDSLILKNKASSLQCLINYLIDGLAKEYPMLNSFAQKKYHDAKESLLEIKRDLSETGAIKLRPIDIVISKKAEEALSLALIDTSCEIELLNRSMFLSDVKDEMLSVYDVFTSIIVTWRNTEERLIQNFGTPEKLLSIQKNILSLYDALYLERKERESLGLDLKKER